MRVRKAWLPLSISLCYVLVFLVTSMLKDYISRGILDVIGWILFAPIGIWFLPLISTSVASHGQMYLVQMGIRFGSMLLNALFMGWLLATIGRHVHARITGKNADN
jgi:hypothetical protein